MFRITKRYHKYIATTMLLLFLTEVLSPTAAMALTSGPSQPEFSSFEPVATTNMVNEFTGDLTYNMPVLNIPGPDGGGYALSLSYHSGTSVEEEASWVGYGWTLNPGAINRNKRGFADDWNGKPITFYNKTVPSRTATLGGSLGDLEVYSIDLSFNGSASIRYNNYKGFGYTLGLGVATTDGVFSLGYHLSDGSSTFSAQVSPGALLNRKKDKSAKADKDKEVTKKRKKLREEVKNLEKGKTPEAKAAVKEAKQALLKARNGGSSTTAQKILGALGNSGYGMLSLANSPAPQLNTPFNGNSFRLNVTFQIDPAPLEISPLSGNLFGSYSTQTNTESRIRNAYGYLHSQAAWSDNNAVMDYDVERPSGFNKHDKVMPVPFSNPDNYALTGEGLGGGFRVHQQTVGEYTPERAESHTLFISGGIDLDVGLATGAGLDGSVGDQFLRMEPWTDSPLANFSGEGDPAGVETSFFRFTHDLAGSIGYGSYSDWNQPRKASGDLNLGGQATSLNAGYTPRSSHIGANTNAQMVKGTGVKLPNPANPADVTTSARAFAYSKREDINSLANRSSSTRSDQYGEFSVTNESGSRYNYGLPVYSRNEETINLEVTSGATFDSKFLAYQSVPSSGSEVDLGAFKSVVGQRAAAEYASTYLLTSITTPDYVDRTQDGPSSDDFGGFTKFNYKKVHGGGDWYRYRSPYEGLNYQRNSFSDHKDDLGGYTAGEKEIYYLESVETKTHIAVFVTSDRHDGLEAKDRNNAAAGTGSTSGLDQLQKLDKIILFRKDAAGNPDKEIQTTFFQYDYSTQTGGTLPNFKTCTTCGGQTGKLTLKKIWSEYNDVYKAKIAPYTFDYEYAHLSGGANYGGLGEDGAYAAFMSHAAGTAQSAAYDPLTVDAWGNYQHNPARHDVYEKWMDQSDNAEPNVDFDPAMWQLKRIGLPSGGEIHVQYEQDDYAYVQHESAHALVRLESSLTSSERDATNGDEYYILDLTDVGIGTSDVVKYADQIRDLYVGTGRKMYFKFFYKLLGFSTPQLEDCDSDFLTGYLDVNQVTVDGSSRIRIYPASSTKPPRKMCREFVRTQKAGNMTTSSCDPTASNSVFNDTGAETVIRNLIGMVQSFNPLDKCVKRNQERSYLRIPIFRGIRGTGAAQKIQGKRGGGLRVKRLLMYDNGAAGNGRSLYGTEYHYVTKDFEGNYISSGVATNEPGIAREENPMVTFMERFKQSFYNRVVAGKDKKEMEGPIGENLLPGPAVGYSRIVTRNIHSGRTHTGYSEKEFYTAYDCPFYYSENQADPIHPQWSINKGAHMTTEIDKSGTSFPISIPAGIVNFSDHRIRARQGFNFAVNNMHGQVKASAAYSNRYLPDASGLYASLETIESEDVMISKEVHTYFAPGESIPTVNSPLGAETNLPLGVEQDIAFESKHIKDKTTSVSIEGDGGVGIFGIFPIPWISASPSFTSVNNEVFTHVTSKVTSYPAIEKSMSRYQDGIWHHTINEKFDYYSGRPAVTKTFDDFNADNSGLTLQSIAHQPTITTHEFSAPMVYNNMGQKAEHEGKFVPAGGTYNMSMTAGNVVAFGSTDPAVLCDAAATFPEGSLIQLTSGMGGGTERDIFHVDRFEDGNMHLMPVSYASFTGTTGPVGIKILRSGRTNQLVTSAGNITIYGDGATTSTQPSAAQLAQMDALVAALNAALPSGNISGSTIQSLTSGIDIMVDGVCQPWPADHHISFKNGLLEVYTQAYVQVPFELDCQEISPYVVQYLNEYWEAFLMDVSEFQFVENPCKDYKWEINGDTWGYNLAGNIPSQLQDVAHEIFSRNVHPSLDRKCEVPLSDFFKPIFRTPHPILSQQGKKGKERFRNGEIIIYDLQAKCYYVVFVECDKEGQLWLYYGATNDLGIGVSPKYTDYTQLQRVPFNPTTNHGLFTQYGEGCDIFFEYPEAKTGKKRTHRLGRVSLPPRTCYEQVLVDKVVCANQLPNIAHGNFDIEEAGGAYNLVFYPYGWSCNATTIPITCLSFCEFSSTTIHDVVSSTFTVFDNDWPFDHARYALTASEASNFGFTNPFETGERGKWRQGSQHVYVKDRGLLSNYAGEDERNFNTGVYDLLMFDWEYPDSYNQYKRTGTVTQYEPNGQVIEEKNIIDVYGSAKYGYNHTVPYLVSANSDYASSFYESFENLYSSTYLEDGYQLSGGTIYTNDAHAGKQCLKLTPTADGLKVIQVVAGSDLQDQGGLLKVWIKSDRSARELIDDELYCNAINTGGTQIGSYDFNEIARSGDWALYQSVVPAGLPANTTLRMRYDFNYPFENFLVDDLRMQPREAEGKAYVYDPVTLRLLATFDDQHFGEYYQYNDEGQLVRKLKETTRGMKTVVERQYNTPEVITAPW